MNIKEIVENWHEENFTFIDDAAQASLIAQLENAAIPRVTVADTLATLPDDALNALAAKARNLKLELVGDTYHWLDGEQIIGLRDDWQPTHDANQALALLAWAEAEGIAEFEICIRSLPRVVVHPEGRLIFTVLGEGARAITIAFILAMQKKD